MINRVRQLREAARRNTAKEQSVRARRCGLQSLFLIASPCRKNLSSFETPNRVADCFGLPDSVARDLVNHDAATKDIITGCIDHRKNSCHADKSNKAVRNNVVGWSPHPNALPAMRQAGCYVTVIIRLSRLYIMSPQKIFLLSEHPVTAGSTSIKAELKASLALNLLLLIALISSVSSVSLLWPAQAIQVLLSRILAASTRSTELSTDWPH